MTGKLLYALVSAAVVGGVSTGLTALADYAPKGAAGEALERFVLAPGQMLAERLEDEKTVRALRKRTRKESKKVRKGLDKAADAIDEKLAGYELEGASRSVRDNFERLTKVYTVASWTAIGFALSLLLTMALGISSLKTAVSLGVKLTLAMIFLQAALVFGGVLVYQRLTA